MNLRLTNSHYVLLFGILAAGAWLRLRNLGADSIWLDEAVSWVQSKGTLAELISATAQDNYPPLHNILLFAFLNVSGVDAEWLLRLPSALLGIANLLAIYWLGLLVGGRAVGLFAAAILATCGAHVYLSQEARMYSLLALSATLYAASAFLFLKSPTFSRAALVAVCGLALVYSHPFGTLNWIAIAVGVSVLMLLAADFPRRGLVQWIAANAAIGVGFLPWALILLQRARGIAGHFWIPFPTVEHVYSEIYGLVGGRLTGAALSICAAFGLRANFRIGGILLAWAVIPIGVALIVSLLSTSIFLGRYFIGALPAVVTLAALGLANLSRHAKLPGAAAAAVLLIAMTIGNLRYRTEARDDWRSVVAHLQRQVAKPDCILVLPSYQVAPLRYYLRGDFCTILPDSIASADLEAKGTDRLFAVLVLSGPNPPDVDAFRAAMAAFGREVARHDSIPAFVIAEYRRQH